MVCLNEEQLKNRRLDKFVIFYLSLLYNLFLLYSQLSFWLIQLLMGNSEAPKRVSKFGQPSRYGRNSYSLQQNSFFSNQLSQNDLRESSIKPRQLSARAKESPILLDNIAELAQPMPSMQLMPKINVSELPEATIRKSISVSVTKSKDKVELNYKLNKLNSKNDDLRKQLMSISSSLTEQLRRKKFSLKKKQAEEGKEEKKEDPTAMMAIKRELQNGHKEIARLKKYIENLKKNEGNAKNQDLTNDIEAKINSVEFDISEIRFQIQTAREVENGILQELKETEGIADFNELEPFKKEIERLRKLSKKQVKGVRARFQKEKIMQEYMFQLERRKRQINGEYLPEIKSYANKNYSPDPKPQKKKNDQYLNYKPAAWEVKDLREEVKTLKERHQEYHARMDKALKAKTATKQEADRVKLELEGTTKELEGLVYKKQRYMQLVMSNLSYLMNENDIEEDGLSISGDSSPDAITVISKGNDLPDQVNFDDHNLIKNIDYKAIKIVSVNIWFNNKRQISVLQMIYFNGKDCFLGNRSSEVREEMEREVLQLEEGDYIKNFMGIFSQKGAIQFLAFYSAKGKARQFGKEMINGLNFSLHLTKKQRPVCLSGSTFFDGNSMRINKLTVDVISE